MNIGNDLADDPNSTDAGERVARPLHDFVSDMILTTGK